MYMYCTVDSEIDEKEYELIQVMSDLNRYLS